MGTPAKITENLDLLLNQVAEVEKNRQSKTTNLNKIINNLEQLIEKFEEFESQKNSEEELNKKIEKLSEQLEKIIKKTGYQQEKKPVEDTIKQYISVAKIGGQVIEIVAGSVELMFDTVLKIIKEKNNGTLSNDAAPADVKTSKDIDLSALLQSVSGIINTLSNTPKEKPAGENPPAGE